MNESVEFPYEQLFADLDNDPIREDHRALCVQIIADFLRFMAAGRTDKETAMMAVALVWVVSPGAFDDHSAKDLCNRRRWNTCEFDRMVAAASRRIGLKNPCQSHYSDKRRVGDMRKRISKESFR